MDTKNLFLECLGNVSKEISIEVDLSFDIASKIDSILAERGISPKEFAELMGKRESEVSKWLKGTHNFTLRTLAKISAVLDSPIIQVVTKQLDVYEQRDYSINVLFHIPHRNYSHIRTNNNRTMDYQRYSQPITTIC